MAAAAMALMISQPAHAQTMYDFKMPSDFVANGKALKAGDYAFVSNASGSVFTLEPRTGKGPTVMLPVESRLSEDGSLTQPVVVLDKYDGKLVVSELEVPGSDGYLFFAAKAKHTHEKVVGKPRKG